MDDNHLHQPLLPLSSHPTIAATATTSATTSRATSTTDTNNKITSSNFDIALRFFLILCIGSVSIWASREASKGFGITVINDMKNTPLGDKFSLFYISNDEATRLVQSATNFATKILNPMADSVPEKIIDQVELHLANHNLAHDDQVVVTKHLGHKNKYVLSISPSVMEYDDFRYRIRKGIQRCMAEILVSNQPNAAPETLRDGMVEYISNSAGFGDPKPGVKLEDFGRKCWEAKDPKIVAQFLGCGEKEKQGFIGRLNQVTRDGWHEEMVHRALGMPAEHLCESFH